MNCIKEQLLQIQEKLNDLMDSDASQEEAVFRVYQMDYPDYEFYDTLAASRRAFRYLANHQLHTVAAECGYCLDNHHHALADAEACAWIAREIL